jgi:hypothetical protein
MNPEMQAKWDEAFANSGVKIPLGRLVVCDICDEDWTDRPEPGGFLFGTYAYCPNCAVDGLRAIKRFNEEHLIVALCGGESFADFVRSRRGPEAFIRVTKS